MISGKSGSVATQRQSHRDPSAGLLLPFRFLNGLFFGLHVLLLLVRASLPIPLLDHLVHTAAVITLVVALLEKDLVLDLQEFLLTGVEVGKIVLPGLLMRSIISHRGSEVPSSRVEAALAPSIAAPWTTAAWT